MRSNVQVATMSGYDLKLKHNFFTKQNILLQDNDPQRMGKVNLRILKMNKMRCKHTSCFT